jgi:hypothetical protein
MNKYSYFDLVLKFIKEKNTNSFWNELNQVIKTHNNYFRKLDLTQRIKLASETGISTIKDQDYKSFEQLRSGIILFPSDKKVEIDDIELLILILKRCNAVYSFQLNKNEIFDESKDDFVVFINKIDEYIKSFTYEQILSKPDFFLDLEDSNIQAYINDKPPPELMHFSQNTDIAKLNMDKDICSVKKASTEVLDDFSQKKKFFDLITEFISRDKIFVDSKQKLIFEYQYLINNFFNKFINEYIKKNNLETDDILFIYKGGTFMKILFQKYNNLLKSNEQFKKMNEDYFKRSDSDYALFISQKFNRNDYTKHYYWMNIMTYNILTKISSFIDENISDILPINEIKEEDLKNQLEKINKLLSDDRDRSNVEKQKRLTYFDGVKEFIGISIGNKTYMKEQIPEKFNLKILKSTSMTDNTKFKYNNEYIDKSEFMKKNRYIPIQREPFYITIKEKGKKYYQALCNINNKPLNSGVYQYYNETNRFNTLYGNKINYFTLHRVKLNVILYFKTWSKYETNVAYGFFQCPSELIDIPISTYDDFKRIINFNEYIQKYENNIDNVNFTFNAYSIYGIIDDICKALFVEQEYPWTDAKYEKKINRLVYFFLIYLNNAYSNWDEIKTKLENYFNTYNIGDAKLNFKTYEDKEIIEDKLYEKILNYLSEVYQRVKTSGNKIYIDKMDLIKNIFLSNLNIFNQEEIHDNISESGSESVPYLKKYLKYKQKYLAIKNKSV